MSRPEDIIAANHLAELREDASLLTKLIETFRRQTSHDMDSLRIAIDDAMPIDVARSAHSIAGAAGSLGGHRLSAICRSIERLGRECTLDGAPDLLCQAHLEYEYLCNALDQVSSELNACKR